VNENLQSKIPKLDQPFIIPQMMQKKKKQVDEADMVENEEQFSNILENFAKFAK